MSNYLPESFIEEIISKNNIVDIISEYVKISKKGKDYFGLCPFHSEKTPSFSVVPTKQIYYCFGCSAGGNVIKFIMDIENLEYLDAIKLLADKVNMSLPESDNPVFKKKTEKAKLQYKMHIDAANFYYKTLRSQESKVAQDYLRNRGLHNDIIDRFALGYAPAEWHSLVDFLKNKGYKEKDIVDAGLGKSKNEHFYDTFRGRIIFPIVDVRNRVIGFGGRILEKSNDKDPKYINSPETLIYNKRMNLYGMNVAKNTKEKNIIVVEGYMDCVALHQGGFNNVVASLGTALTKKQGNLIKYITNEIIISFDTDTAGQAATLRGLDLLANMECSVKILRVENGKDPDEFIKVNGSEAFREQIKHAYTLVEYKAKILRDEFNVESTDGAINFLKGISKAISQVTSSVEREMYIKKIAHEYKISEESILLEVKKHLGQISNEEISKNKNIRINTIRKGKESNVIFLVALAIISYDSSLAAIFINSGIDTYIKDEKIKRLFESIKERVKNHKKIDSANVIELIEEKEAAVFAGLCTTVESIEDTSKALNEQIIQYKVLTLMKRNDQIIDLLELSNNNSKVDRENLQRELLVNINKIRDIKK